MNLGNVDFRLEHLGWEATVKRDLPAGWEKCSGKFFTLSRLDFKSVRGARLSRRNLVGEDDDFFPSCNDFIQVLCMLETYIDGLN